VKLRRTDSILEANPRSDTPLSQDHRVVTTTWRSPDHCPGVWQRRWRIKSGDRVSRQIAPFRRASMTDLRGWKPVSFADDDDEEEGDDEEEDEDE
jgi:hypothetical protein